MNSTVILASSHGIISDSNLVYSNLDLDPDLSRVPAFVEYASTNVTDSSSIIENMFILMGSMLYRACFNFMLSVDVSKFIHVR